MIKRIPEETRKLIIAMREKCPTCGHRPSYEEIGRKFDVSSVTVHNIITGTKRTSHKKSDPAVGKTREIAIKKEVISPWPETVRFDK